MIDLERGNLTKWHIEAIPASNINDKLIAKSNHLAELH